jgi:MMP 1-O-methyltransferase
LVTDWRDHALAAQGFMPPDEGDALHAAALDAPDGPMLEVGSWCGRSTIWLAAAARQRSTVLFAVDHHRGSEENQVGWQWHDPSLVDDETGLIDTLPTFRRNVLAAGLESHVVAVVGASPLVASHWCTPLAFCFIDGGHGRDVAARDRAWFPHVMPGGVLAIHDVFTDPADGGQAPHEELYLPAVERGFVEISRTGSLRIMRCGTRPD